MDTKDRKVVICMVVKPGRHGLGAIRVGERVSVSLAQARALCDQGVLVAVTEPLSRAEIKAAGGLDKYLDANPKLRLMKKADEKRIKESHPQPNQPYPLEEQF